MADPLADPADLASYWRPLTAAEELVAAALLEVASAIVRRRVPDIDTRLADGALDQSIARYVVTEMVKSAVDATNRAVDAKSTSDSAGPYSHSVTFAAAARIALTDDLLPLLGVEVAASTLGSIQLGLPQHHRLGDCYPRVGVWR